MTLKLPKHKLPKPKKGGTPKLITTKNKPGGRQPRTQPSAKSK